MQEKESKDSIHTVVIVVAKGDKILIVKRSATDYWMPLHWSLAGGHIEKGESPYQAAKRELKEETGLIANNLVLLKKQKTLAGNGGILTLYLCDDFDGEVKLNFEHSDFAWVKYDDIQEYKTTPDLKSFVGLALRIPFGY